MLLGRMRLVRRPSSLVALSSLVAGLAGPVVAGEARAQKAPPPAERLLDYSPYEKQTIAEVLEDKGLAADRAPEGKTIERVEIVPLDVFEARDVLPRWLNVFHVTTRKSVIEREVLLHAGDAYRQPVVDDTIRNLRRLPGVPQLSAVLVVAAAGSAPDRVVLVVITKDVWSLRLNWDVVADPGGIDELVLQPSETNFLGTHQILGATFVLEPSTYTVGAHYIVPSLDKSHIAVDASADMVINQRSGEPEGSYGSFVTGQPLFAGDTEWAWDGGASWQDVFLRRYVNARLASFVDPQTAERLPFEYHQNAAAATYEVTRSFGWDFNHDFTLAAAMSRSVFSVPVTKPASLRTVTDFQRQYVPLSDTRVGPSLQYHTYEMRFLRVIDFDTLALQEDYRLGHDVVLRAYPSLRALGSWRDVVSLYGAAQYSWAVRDGLFRISFASDTEPEGDHVADAWIQPAAHFATPTIAGLGRIVVDGTALYRWRNYLNGNETLGGADRLRGYPTNFFVGASYMSYNVEARTRPVEILSLEAAGVAFYDIGDAFSGQLVPYQSVGVGIRTLFPWLDRTVFQTDIAFPLQRPVDPSTGAVIPPYSFIISFGQAFSTPTIGNALSPFAQPAVPGVPITPVLPTGQGADAP
jgi:hypothetical protein